LSIYTLYKLMTSKQFKIGKSDFQKKGINMEDTARNLKNEKKLLGNIFALTKVREIGA